MLNFTPARLMSAEIKEQLRVATAQDLGKAYRVHTSQRYGNHTSEKAEAYMAILECIDRDRQCPTNIDFYNMYENLQKRFRRHDIRRYISDLSDSGILTANYDQRYSCHPPYSIAKEWQPSLLDVEDDEYNRLEQFLFPLWDEADSYRSQRCDDEKYGLFNLIPESWLILDCEFRSLEIYASVIIPIFDDQTEMLLELSNGEAW